MPDNVYQGAGVTVQLAVGEAHRDPRDRGRGGLGEVMQLDRSRFDVRSEVTLDVTGPASALAPRQRAHTQPAQTDATRSARDTGNLPEIDSRVRIVNARAGRPVERSRQVSWAQRGRTLCQSPLRSRTARSLVLAATAAAVLTLVAAVLASGADVASAAAACPNQAVRTGYSAALPACRAYELISPPGIRPYFTSFGQIENATLATKAIFGEELGVTASQSSADSGIGFFSPGAPAGSATDGPYYLSSRGPGGWTTKNLIPPQSTEVTVGCLPFMIAWSENLERGILADGYNSFHPVGTNCGADEPELVPGEPRNGAQNLFMRDTATDSYQLINQSGLVGEPANAHYQGGSNGLGVVVFSEEPAVAPQLKFYVWAGGTVDRLLTILPDGEPTEGEIANATVLGRFKARERTSPTFSHAVAPDGSRVEFTAGGNLYSRMSPAAPQSAFDKAGECDEASKACTVEIDTSETAEPGGGGVFAGGSGADGSVVYFTDTNRLTSDSMATGGEPDLYEYDFSKPLGERLDDLTVDHSVGGHADVLGFVGTNDTGPAGEYAYFVATGVLASEPNSVGALPASGAPNLYMEHAGATSFIATLGLAGDSCGWENRCMTARVSSNGRYIGFDSLEQLTGINNLDVNTFEPDQEIFLYDGEAELLSCASCGETGAAPIAPASIRFPQGLTTVAEPTVLSPQRNVSDNGQVFFDTPNPLVAAARNGSNIYSQSNVYEYANGQLHLLSSGTAESSSFFYEASADGKDVYLITAQALTSGASSEELALYDAKVGGGFPAPPAERAPCSGEACSGAQSPPTQPPSNASETFAGPGNPPSTASTSTAATVRLTKVSFSTGRRTLIVRVSVSGSGRIVASLNGGRGVTRTAVKAGTYVLRLPITARERTALKHRVHLKLSVAYHAGDGLTAHSMRAIDARR